MNQQMGIDCMALIQKKLAKQISKEEYYAGIVELDRKYPGVGFKEAAEKYIRHQEWLDKNCLPLEVWKSKEWPLTKYVKETPERKERLPYKDDVEEVPF